MNRRHFIRGVASSLALPVLPSLAQAEERRRVTRLGFVYIPNGVNVNEWYRAEGLAPSLAPLAGMMEHCSVIRNLESAKAYANGDGGGDHARANASFLTGAQAKKTAGADISVGASIDQVAARAIGYQTRLPSLELSTAEPRRSGRCDSGYSCAYQYNLSWINATTPAPAENDPRVVFEKLYGSGNRLQDQKRRAQKRSVLDFVKQEAHLLNRRLGREDQEKLDEYLTAIRGVEKGIERAESYPIPEPQQAAPEGIPESYREHIRLQFQMMKLAWQTDSTRVTTFMLASEGSGRTFPEISVYGKHHELSHHRGSESSLAALAEIDRFYAAEFARFLQQLADTPDGEGESLLDNSAIIYGGGIQDGNLHNHTDLPIILAGHAGGLISHNGQHWAKERTPVTNLYLSLLSHMGVELPRFGDSTGKLKV